MKSVFKDNQPGNQHYKKTVYIITNLMKSCESKTVQLIVNAVECKTEISKAILDVKDNSFLIKTLRITIFKCGVKNDIVTGILFSSYCTVLLVWYCFPRMVLAVVSSSPNPAVAIVLNVLW